MKYIRDGPRKIIPNNWKSGYRNRGNIKTTLWEKKYRLVNTEEKYIKNKYGQNVKIITKYYKEHEQIIMFEWRINKLHKSREHTVHGNIKRRTTYCNARKIQSIRNFWKHNDERR